MLLMSLMTTTFVTKNQIDYENRLLDESYYIAQFLQGEIFNLGVRSIEDLSTEDKQIFRVNHEYIIDISESSGVIRRYYETRESYILMYNQATRNVYYGREENFDYGAAVFENPTAYRINDAQVQVGPDTVLHYVCLGDDVFQNEEVKCNSAIIELTLELAFIIDGNVLFRPKTFRTTIIF